MKWFGTSHWIKKSFLWEEYRQGNLEVLFIMGKGTSLMNGKVLIWVSSTSCHLLPYEAALRTPEKFYFGRRGIQSGSECSPGNHNLTAHENRSIGCHNKQTGWIPWFQKLLLDSGYILPAWAQSSRACSAHSLLSWQVVRNQDKVCLCSSQK